MRLRDFDGYKSPGAGFVGQASCLSAPAQTRVSALLQYIQIQLAVDFRRHALEPGFPDQRVSFDGLRPGLSRACRENAAVARRYFLLISISRSAV